MKVGLIGAGEVGRACLLSLVMEGSAGEIVLVNRTPERARGMITDLRYGAALAGDTRLTAGGYDDLAGASLVIITAGVNEKTGGATDRNDDAGRLRLLEQNAAVYRDIVPRIAAAAPAAVLLVVTDPPDPLAALARQLAGLDHADRQSQLQLRTPRAGASAGEGVARPADTAERVISTGTLLDSERLRFHVAERIGVHPASVQGQVLGEHGTSQVVAWSGVRVGGVPLQKVLGLDDGRMAAFRQEVEEAVRYANITIIEGTGASQLGIGVVTARIARAILRDERVVLPVASHVPEFGTTLSVPSLVGRAGVLGRLLPELPADEAQALVRSAETIASAVEAIGP